MTDTEEIGRGLGTDYFMIRESLSDRELELLERTRHFVDDEVLPVIVGHWERAEFPADLARRLGELGLIGDGIEAPGVPEMSPLAAGLVNMELNRGDGSLGTFLGVQAGLAMRSIAELGSDAQRERWLGPLARAEAFGAFALTEPDHGSDSVSLETAARRDGDGWVLDGRKRWIGNATVADVVVVWARAEEDGEVKGFLVEPAVTAGFEAVRIEGKGSVRAVWQADIELDGAQVPESARLPGAGSFADTSRVLAATRLTCAFSALGHAVGAYEAALTYAKEREQFGKTLVHFQTVQRKLVEMLAEVTGMQLYCLQCARLGDEGMLRDTFAGLAKMNNTTKARWVISQARELLGGNGILLENHVIRHMVDIESIHTFEGTADIQALIVGRDVTGVGAFT